MFERGEVGKNPESSQYVPKYELVKQDILANPDIILTGESFRPGIAQEVEDFNFLFAPSVQSLKLMSVIGCLEHKID